MTDKKYVIYQNDLKHRNMTKLDINKIDWDKNDIRHLYNINHDTLEYRLNESGKDNYHNMDLTNINLTEIPKQIINNILYSNLIHLFISNNNLKDTIDLSIFKKLETLDIDNNSIDNIILPISLKELSVCNNKLKHINCNNNLSRLKCSFNLIENININKTIEIIIVDNNKLTNLNLTNYNNCKKIVIFNNPLQQLIISPNIEYIDMSETLIFKLNDSDNLIHLVANSCKNLTKLQKYKNIEYIEVIDTPIDKLYYYEKYKLILLQINLTKNISKKYKDNNANIQIRNNILLAISKSIDFF
jgi:hypothetical protein